MCRTGTHLDPPRGKQTGYSASLRGVFFVRYIPLLRGETKKANTRFDKFVLPIFIVTYQQITRPLDFSVGKCVAMRTGTPGQKYFQK
jgi:hypothetical protein